MAEDCGAHIGAAGTCMYVDDGARVEWSSTHAMAQQYWRDHARTGDGSYGPAQQFVAEMTDDGHPAVVEVMQALVDTAPSDAEIDYVGAGPLEDLLSHSGHGAAFVDAVELRARQNPSFRTAVRGLWLGDDVPPDVRTRLAKFGARLL